VVTISLDFPVQTVAPGAEDTQCVVLTVPTAGAVRVESMRNTLEAGAVELALFRTSDPEQTTPVACQFFQGTTDGNLLMLTHKPDDVLQFPAGVGYLFDPQQRVRMMLHLYNPGAVPLDVHVRATFTINADVANHVEAGLLLMMNPDVVIPPGGVASLTSFLDVPAVGPLAGASFFRMMGYTHALGTAVTAVTGPGAAGPMTVRYDPTWDPSNPAEALFEPAFGLPSPGGFGFTCQWNNTGGNSVGSGTSVLDEMCLVQASFYPATSSLVCVHTAQGGGQDFCCPGSALCSGVFP
jgi:hypothetical protein